MVNIGQASRKTGLPVKTIRYYEEIGLIEPDRGENGYRDFDEEDLSRLRFLAQARHLGFTLEECRRLMRLYCDAHRASRDVRDLAVNHLEEIRDRIRQLQELEKTLEKVIAECRGDDDPHCAILETLANGS